MGAEGVLGLGDGLPLESGRGLGTVGRDADEEGLTLGPGRGTCAAGLAEGVPGRVDPRRC